MGFESRKGKGRYLYLSRRVDGRVTKEYIGKGALAESLSDRLTLARAEHRTARIAAQIENERDTEATIPLTELCKYPDLLVKATLLTAGFHTHKGQWRRRRHVHQEEKAATED